jgi:hypothetical protein
MHYPKFCLLHMLGLGSIAKGGNEGTHEYLVQVQATLRMQYVQEFYQVCQYFELCSIRMPASRG